MSECAICRQSSEFFESAAAASRGFVCKTCGRYVITHVAYKSLEALNVSDRRLAALSAFTRQATKRGETPVLKSDNWEALAAGHLHTPVSTKLRRVLERMEELTNRAGEAVQIDGVRDYPLFDAQPSEVAFLLASLISRNLIANKQSGYVITADGWDSLEPGRGGSVPGTCFVAMSFKTEHEVAYDDGIKPALVDDCGFAVIQLSRVENAENINDKIIADIRRAQFIVADFTFHPAGVYFEAGFALGLGKLVVWTCKKADFKENVHFDTRPYNHILWETPSELREKLTNHVRALAPNAKST